MRPTFLGDERGAVSADQVIVVSGVAVVCGLCFYTIAGWADVAWDEFGASSAGYTAGAPGLADVTEADFTSAMRDTSRN